MTLTMIPTWEFQLCFFDSPRELYGDERKQGEAAIIAHHYLHSFPSGKTHLFQVEDALIAYSIPANAYLASYLLWPGAVVWELSRLWAPDRHAKNLLTQAIAVTIGLLRQVEPDVICCVSYADPNAGHHGGVYRAASWHYLGQVEDQRAWLASDGRMIARRAFHSARSFLRKPEIEALGYTEVKRPGKYRYARPLTKKARKMLLHKFGEKS